jgi:hypothetical protein
MVQKFPETAGIRIMMRFVRLSFYSISRQKEMVAGRSLILVHKEQLWGCNRTPGKPKTDKFSRYPPVRIRFHFSLAD